MDPQVANGFAKSIQQIELPNCVLVSVSTGQMDPQVANGFAKSIQQIELPNCQSKFELPNRAA
jgi:lipoate synthase